jgi:hypothetical protein
MNHFHKAAADLHFDYSQYQYPQEITEERALGYVTPEVISCWFAGSIHDSQTPQQRLVEALVESLVNLSEVDTIHLLSALALNTVQTGDKFQAMLRSWVARALVRAANNMEPTDAELERPYNPALMDRINARYGS